VEKCSLYLIYLAGKRAIDDPAHFLRGKRGERLERWLRFVQERHAAVEAWFAYLETSSASNLRLKQRIFHLERRHCIRQSKSFSQQEISGLHDLDNEQAGMLTEGSLVTFGSILKQCGHIVKIVAAWKVHERIVLHVAARSADGPGNRQ